MSAPQTSSDIPLLIKSANSASERRVTPAWTIAHLKTRLEPITGIPASAQTLSLRVGSQEAVAIQAADEESVQLHSFSLQAYAEIMVTDTRPPGSRTDYTDVSKVDKYVMPAQEYETLPNSVLAWKKNQKLGRFDPNAPDLEQQKIKALEREIEERGITLNARARLLPANDARLGTVSYIGPIPQILGSLGAWIGITLDEPTGKNDGSIPSKGKEGEDGFIEGARYFQCLPKCGVFVRPERVEIGDFPAADDFGEEMEEM
ncbi:hypothetical protein BLS_001520 [Venturia inaequalis]|uniref:CAP-Gly domain-containing protein n=1 Tax=Venturia inaequalis TaxID=5025 RepID=A0A8H3U1T5_VENIN|nr:hypothetical protein BLS_001520 [Venturia inaequalis]KAE9973037.1 hypothetical protein EG328_004649 [Venturia inaequalis]KAE9988445.1 hypothetical protein EG327_003373 [Venturia inaequalis]RDI87470.1 hypothetical protein Vi05172_g2503 [Venturia inaequalis]